MSMHDQNDEEAKLASVERVELLISYLLRIGVITSMVIVIAGLTLTFLHHPEYANEGGALASIKSGHMDWPRTLREEMAGLQHARGSAVVVLGLVVLIATPVLRVAVSILIFARQRDGVFVAITAVVLALLLLSFVMGRARLIAGE